MCSKDCKFYKSKILPKKKNFDLNINFFLFILLILSLINIAIIKIMSFDKSRAKNVVLPKDLKHIYSQQK